MENQIVRSRNGFVTFWLWVMIIINIMIGCFYMYAVTNHDGANVGDTVGASMYAVTENSEIAENLAHMVVASSIIVAICLFVNAIAAFLLLRWKKVGFKLIICAAVCAYVGKIIVSLIYGADFVGTLKGSLLYAILSIVAIGILYAILHIRKNGVSCWSQLQ